jgi:hypothetical protein
MEYPLWVCPDIKWLVKGLWAAIADRGFAPDKGIFDRSVVALRAGPEAEKTAWAKGGIVGIPSDQGYNQGTWSL